MIWTNDLQNNVLTVLQMSYMYSRPNVGGLHIFVIHYSGEGGGGREVRRNQPVTDITRDYHPNILFKFTISL